MEMSLENLTLSERSQNDILEDFKKRKGGEGRRRKSRGEGRQVGRGGREEAREKRTTVFSRHFSVPAGPTLLPYLKVAGCLSVPAVVIRPRMKQQLTHRMRGLSRWISVSTSAPLYNLEKKVETGSF